MSKPTTSEPRESNGKYSLGMFASRSRKWRTQPALRSCPSYCGVKHSLEGKEVAGFWSVLASYHCMSAFHVAQLCARSLEIGKFSVVGISNAAVLVALFLSVWP